MAGVTGFGVEADLVAGGVVAVELLHEPLVLPKFTVGIVMGDEAERGLGVVTGECSDEGEDVIAKVESEGLFIFVWGTWNRK